MLVGTASIAFCGSSQSKVQVEGRCGLRTLHGEVNNNVTAVDITGQNIAMALGGVATPPRVFNGELVRKKLHLCSSSHCSASLSRSHISPIGQPQPARRKSCISTIVLVSILNLDIAVIF